MCSAISSRWSLEPPEVVSRLVTDFQAQVFYGIDRDSARSLRPTQPKGLADQAAHTGHFPSWILLMLVWEWLRVLEAQCPAVEQ